MVKGVYAGTGVLRRVNGSARRCGAESRRKIEEGVKYYLDSKNGGRCCNCEKGRQVGCKKDRM